MQAPFVFLTISSCTTQLSRLEHVGSGAAALALRYDPFRPAIHLLAAIVDCEECRCLPFPVTWLMIACGEIVASASSISLRRSFYSGLVLVRRFLGTSY